ncbi:MAG: ABC transporter permease [Nitrososphaerales archaeon]
MARGNIGRYLVKRLLSALIVIIGVTAVIFVVSRLSGDPVDLMLGLEATPESRAALRHALGLDQPLHIQYFIFLSNALRGDFGVSIRNNVPAMQLVLERLPNTILLTLVTVLLAVAVAIPIGIVSALKHNTILDYLGMTFTFVGQSIPSFWLGILLILFLGVQLRLLPISGIGTPAHLVMPAITLSSFLLASLARLTRSSMLETLNRDYIRTAQAKGLKYSRVIIRHALRTALIPVVTVLGLQIAALMGGAVITEQIFAYPGVGWLAITAIYARDFPVVQAVVFVVSVIVVLANLVVDIVYTYLDPRIGYE